MTRKREKLLLIATIEHLLHHEIALRETSSQGALSHLSFDEIEYEQPESDEQPEPTVMFAFEGPTQNIYTTLIVRLCGSEFLSRPPLEERRPFQRDCRRQMWLGVA